MMPISPTAASVFPLSRTPRDMASFRAWMDAIEAAVNGFGGASGDVVGPASAGDGNIALFDGATGKLLKDAGFAPVSASDVSSAIAAAAALLVDKALFNAHTILAATADNTPAALTVGEQTVVGRLTSGNIKALSQAELTALGNAVVGDSGAGGTKGLVPAPGAGDTAAGKFLKANGLWDVPAGGGSGDVVGPASAVDEQIAVFDSTTGKLIKDGGTTIAALSASILSAVRDGVDAAFDTLAEIAAKLDVLDNPFTGDSGAGGAAGLVPAPAAGDAAAGKFLSADGSWDTPAGGGGGQTVTEIESGSLSGTAVDITDIPATFSHLILDIFGASSDTSTRRPLVQVSTNNGSSFDTTATNYVGATSNGGTGDSNALATIAQKAADHLNSIAFNMHVKIFGYQNGMRCSATACGEAQNIGFTSEIVYKGSTSAINALRILWNGSGNFDAGTYTLYGIGAGS